ncbi:MAG: ADP-ribosylglycohydrolase family protein [Streptosporangiaceae bacterium]
MSIGDGQPLAPAHGDRVAGVLLGLACGDALGAGYEFRPPRIHGEPVLMAGGGGFGWAPGEWTDDTSMAVAIAETAATGVDLRSSQALDAITARFVTWMGEAKDIGVQTSGILSSVSGCPSAAAAAAEARRWFERTGKTGNGSLMRTAPVALAYLDDPEALVGAAHAVSELTHGDAEAGEACALWCLAIRHAVLYGTFEGLTEAALSGLPGHRAQVWATRLRDAESVEPHQIEHNGWVVAALMAAWSAIMRTPVPANDPAAASFPGLHLRRALEAAVRAGNDTDTVAAIAGALLGARWGVSAVPLAWRRILHGWPGLRGRDLIALALQTARGGRQDPAGWPAVALFDYSGYGDISMLAVHPHDPGVLLGGVGAVRALPNGVDAVISLCRLGAAEVPARGVRPADHLEAWLSDTADPAANPNLDLVLAEAADTVATLREEGRKVLVHCVQAKTRTPAVAAVYSSRYRGVNSRQAFSDIRELLPEAHLNNGYHAALTRLDPSAW